MIVTDLQQWDCTAVILAGGAASRFDGKNKGLQLLAGKPLVEHVSLAFPPQWPLRLATHGNAAEFERLGYHCIEDRHPEYAGPMKALAELAPFIETRYVAVSPCDTPFLSRTVYEQLATSLTTASFAVFQARQHYCCLMAEAQALQNLAEVPRSMRHLLTLLNANAVEIHTNANCFMNINTAQALHVAEQALQQQQ